MLGREDHTVTSLQVISACTEMGLQRVLILYNAGRITAYKRIDGRLLATDEKLRST